MRLWGAKVAPQGLNQACKRCQTGPKKRIAQASGDAALDIRLCWAGKWGFAEQPLRHAAREATEPCREPAAFLSHIAQLATHGCMRSLIQ